MALTAGSAVSQESLAGRRVVVINDKAPLAVSGQAVSMAEECTVFSVNKVDGVWLWIKSEQAYLRRGDVVPFEDALCHYTRQLEANRTASNYWNRAKIWRLKGQLNCAMGDMNSAIQLDPTQPLWFIGRGILWYDLKEHDKAVSDHSKAIRLDPRNVSAYGNRANAWTAKKEFDKAIADFNEALNRDTQRVKTGSLGHAEFTGGDSASMVNSRALSLNNRGNAWRKKGDYGNAIADYEEAIRIDPRFKNPHNGLAWLRATCPDEKHRNGQQAVEYATKLCEMTAWKVANSLDTLAAAYAEAGDFAKAAEWEQKGIDLAPVDKKADYVTRLKLYGDHKPYRDTAK